MTETLEGIKGVEASQDDILVTGRTLEEHDERLTKVLDVIPEAGLKLNEKKCVWRQPSLIFLGHKFDGVRPDPAKVKAIVQMSVPTNVQEVRQFRGMVNYIGMFIPNLATMMKPINDLLKKDVQWRPVPCSQPKKYMHKSKKSVWRVFRHVRSSIDIFVVYKSLSYLPTINHSYR